VNQEFPCAMNESLRRPTVSTKALGTKMSAREKSQGTKNQRIVAKEEVVDVLMYKKM